MKDTYKHIYKEREKGDKAEGAELFNNKEGGRGKETEPSLMNI